MAGQRNDAAERSAHVTRGGAREESARRSTIVELPNGACVLRAVYVRDRVIQWLSARRAAQKARADLAMEILRELRMAVAGQGDMSAAKDRADALLRGKR